MKKGLISLTGTIIKLLPNAYYLVKADKTDSEVLCRLSGQMTKFFIKPVEKDRVSIEVSETDLTKGRIMKRF